jgi:hypothetical protein
VKENYYLYKKKLHTDQASGDLIVEVTLLCLEVYGIGISTMLYVRSLEIREADRQLEC